MLGAILTLSMFFDIHTHKVPNAFIMLGMIWGLCTLGVGFIPPFLVVLMVGFILYFLGMMGAGDIKLMSIIAGNLGFYQGLRCIGLAWLLGAAYSLFILIYNKTLLDRLFYFLVYFRQLFQTKKFTPYYDQNCDGYINTISFTVPLAIAYLLQIVLWIFEGRTL